MIRHREHISTALTKSKKAAEVAQADGLLASLQSLSARADRLLTRAEDVLEQAAKDGKQGRVLSAIRSAAPMIREARACQELLAKLRGELQSQPTVNIQVIAPVVLQALDGFPEAKQAVATRLQELDRTYES